MSFRIQHEFFLFGKPSRGFSKDYFYEWDDGLGGAPSQLFLNFESDEQLDGETVGALIFESMKNHFFIDLERDAAKRFEDTLKEINHLIQQKEEEWGLDLVPRLNVIAAVLTQGQLFLTQRGQSEAYLIRKRFLSIVSEGLSDPKNTEELFSEIAQGVLNSDDVILFSSKRLLRYITKSELAKVFSEEGSLTSLFEALQENIALDLNEQVHVLAVRVGEPFQGRGLAMDLDESQENESQSDLSRRFNLSVWKEKLSSIKNRFTPGLRKIFPARAQKIEPTLSPQEYPSEERLSSAHEKKRSGISDRLGFLSEWRELKRDKILMLLIVVVLILLLGIYLVRNQGAKQKYLEDLESKLNQVQLNLSTAQTKGTYDKESATALLNESYEVAMEVLNSGYLRGKASEYLSQIQDQRDQLEGVMRVENPTVFVDFLTVNPTMNALGIFSAQDRMYVYSPHELYEVVLNEIQTPVTIDDEEAVIDGAYFQDNQSMLFLTKSNRVIEYVQGQFSFSDTADGAWHSAVDLEVYNNRVYLLDPPQKEIWRYTRQREGFSGADGYVVDETVDLSQAVSFGIDGSVFILKDDGNIMKLFGGEDEHLTISKAPSTDVSGTTEIDVEFERSQVFVLDPSGSRVLVYNKDPKSGNLVYLRQFILDNVEELRDLYFDKKANRIYVLGVTKVYEISY